MMEKVPAAGGLESSCRENSLAASSRGWLWARIMAYEPEAILLDEPFSALDEFLKDRLAQEMLDLLKDYRGTVILVSHSRDEIYRLPGNF